MWVGGRQAHLAPCWLLTGLGLAGETQASSSTVCLGLLSVVINPKIKAICARQGLFLFQSHITLHEGSGHRNLRQD